MIRWDKVTNNIFIDHYSYWKNYDEIADELEEDVEVIKPTYDVTVKYAPDYDVEKVFEAYKEMKEAVVS